jgi:hypothetical protein
MFVGGGGPAEVEVRVGRVARRRVSGPGRGWRVASVWPATGGRVRRLKMTRKERYVLVGRGPHRSRVCNVPLGMTRLVYRHPYHEGPRAFIHNQRFLQKGTLGKKKLKSSSYNLPCGPRQEFI